MKHPITFLIVIITLASCYKNYKTPTVTGIHTLEKNISVKIKDVPESSYNTKTILSAGKWLAFQTLVDYEMLTDSLSEQDKMVSVADYHTKLGFISLNVFYYDTTHSYNNYSNNPAFSMQLGDSLDNDFFGGVVNPDGIVQIDKYIFKINLVTGFCYVLDTGHIAQFTDLITENTGNPNVARYYNEDDVLDILFGNDVEGRLFCREAGAPGRKWDGVYPYDDKKDKRIQRRLVCKIVYQKAALYFSLQAKVKSQFRWSWEPIWQSDATWLDLNFIDRYKPKCRNEQNGNGRRRDYTNSLSYRAYESSRGLNKYLYQAEFHREDYGSGPYLSSDWHEIRWGY